MKIKLKQVLYPQAKSKIKAGDGKTKGKYKFFTSSPIQTKYIDEAIYYEPSLIFGTGGNASVHFCDEPFSTSTDCLVMYGKSRIELETIHNYLNSNIGILENGFKGAGLKHISKDYILDIDIELPNEKIQLEFLQKKRTIDSLIEAKRTQLILSDELVKSRFIERFGDPITNSKCLPTNNLGKVLLLKAGDFTAASDIAAEPTTENIYPCYGGNGIRGYVAEYNQEGSYSLIGRQGALSGNVQYATGKFKNTEHALLVTPLIEMNSIWLNHLLINLDLQRYQTGAAQPGLSVKNLQEIPIIEVSKEDQYQFATFVEQINKSKFEIQQSLEKLETLKKALMQKYFG